MLKITLQCICNDLSTAPACGGSTHDDLFEDWWDVLVLVEDELYRSYSRICTAHAYQLLSLWQVKAPGTDLAQLADKVQGLPQHAKTVAHEIQQVRSISAGTRCVLHSVKCMKLIEDKCANA